ncbi:MAG: S49 family peptidase [Cohaesibacter sp.]|nr:S49 family peptidase [Cohaesibacter sp.]MCV6600456.1 S49 family peptidase [Cohaesibacter sp.]
MKKKLKQFLPEKYRKEPTIIPVVRMSGPIMVGSQMRPGLSMASVAGQLHKAFSIKDAPAVAIAINSPGGSPVQSRLIYQRIRQLAQEKDKKVITFCEDAAASGGYMIAIAGDEIVADPSSIVGSIGVVSGGFGFVDAIEKLGVERRVYTAGTQKAMLDPFKPENPEHLAHLNALLEDLFETFKDLVRSRRGDKLTKDEDELFTGAFWTGKKGKDFGLVDDLGDMNGYLKQKYGEDTKLKLISSSGGFFSRLRMPGMGLMTQTIDPLERIATGLSADSILASLEERALWSRLGL